MDIILTSLIGWILLPIYWFYYRNLRIKPGNIINIFSVKLGKNIFIGANNWFKQHVTVGDYTYISNRCNFSFVDIGKYCSISSNVTTIPFGHNYLQFSNYPFCLLAKNKPDYEKLYNREVVFYGSTKIGNDVWLGEGVKIIGGSVIENGVVVGANSLVKGRLVAYGIYGGSPAKLIKFRFSDKKITQLIKSKWYDKDFESVMEYALNSNNS